MSVWGTIRGAGRHYLGRGSELVGKNSPLFRSRTGYLLGGDPLSAAFNVSGGVAGARKGYEEGGITGGLAGGLAGFGAMRAAYGGAELARKSMYRSMTDLARKNPNFAWMGASPGKFRHFAGTQLQNAANKTDKAMGFEGNLANSKWVNNFASKLKAPREQVLKDGIRTGQRTMSRGNIGDVKLRAALGLPLAAGAMIGGDMLHNSMNEDAMNMYRRASGKMSQRRIDHHNNKEYLRHISPELSSTKFSALRQKYALLDKRDLRGEDVPVVDTYSSFKKMLKPGDIILTKPSLKAKGLQSYVFDKGNQVISWAQGSKNRWFHSAMHIGDGKQIHSQLGKKFRGKKIVLNDKDSEIKIREQPISIYGDTSDLLIMRPDVSSKEKIKAVQNVKKLRGIGYSNLDILQAALKPGGRELDPKKIPKDLMCHGAVSWAYQDAIDFRPGKSKKHVLANHIFDNPKLKPIAAFSPDTKTANPIETVPATPEKAQSKFKAPSPLKMSDPMKLQELPNLPKYPTLLSTGMPSKIKVM